MSSPTPASGQEHAVKKMHSKVMIDAKILSAFVNQPCENSQSARTAFLAGNHQKGAKHLETASAFMRLESARADAASRVAIEKSIGELEQLASAVEQGEIQLYSVMQNAFVDVNQSGRIEHGCCQV